MNAYCSKILVLICTTLQLGAQTPPTLTVEDAVARGLARPEQAALLDGRLAAAEATALAMRTRDNPELSVGTEQLSPGGVDSRETTLLVSQRLELFGARAHRARAADHETAATAYRNQAERRDTETLIRALFYEVLYLQARVAALADWLHEAGDIARMVTLREQAGEVSGYDRRRLARELAEAEALIAGDRALHAARWEELRTLLALDAPHTLVGPLLPPTTPEPDPAAHPALRALDEMRAAAEQREASLRHGGFSEITLEAGLKNTRIAGDADTGLVVSARLPLPLFNRKRGARLHARAQAATARGEKALAVSRATGRMRALQAQIRVQRAATETYRVQAGEASRELVRISRIAYREGELDLPGLLEAYRTRRDADLKLLAMEADIRGLTLELARVGGGK